MKPLIYQYRVQWRELLQCVGIVPDNISSLVHAGNRMCLPWKI